jgi:hypothetical protein
LDFPTEAIFVSGREIFSPTEQGVGVPTAREAGAKIADLRQKAREREISNNFSESNHLTVKIANHQIPNPDRHKS